MASMVPFHSVHYYLREWRQARLWYVYMINAPPVSFFFSSPQNPHKLFNLRHVALQNIIEWIFGVMKCHWHLLQFPAKYDMDIQAHIPTALCTLHNFMCWYDPDEMFDPGDVHWLSEYSSTAWTFVVVFITDEQCVLVSNHHDIHTIVTTTKTSYCMDWSFTCNHTFRTSISDMPWKTIAWFTLLTR